MVSLFTAFSISNWMFQTRIHDIVYDGLLTDGQKIIQAYQSTPSAELVPFMQHFSGYSGNLLQLYKKDREPLLQEIEPIHVDPRDIELVLANNITRTLDANIHSIPMVGIPLQINGEPYAMFISLQHNRVEEELMHSIHVLYMLILFFGSFLILIAARYVVNPIRRLTEATKKMAKGTFDREGLSTKRKDEIGQLSISFHEMAEELTKLDQMRNEFVSSVSHEIQSPLTSITGFTKALKQKKLSEEVRLKYLTIIEEESERLSRLGQNLLQLSYLQQDHHPLKVRAYRLDEQLRRIVITLEPLWKAKEIEMDVEMEGIAIEADQDQLDQVWINLLSNAIKFTPPQGMIRIRSTENAHHVVVSITDNGIGIPEEERAYIFKPFHKVDKARNSSVKGNGLGLSIVKQIIDLHHGDIHVSSSLGTGTTFSVTLNKKNVLSRQEDEK
ncbi:histidine kinase [Brevibacillus panacihumi W25]|uniref:Heme sensor protein HssS n=2 Tax=Brevibacillus panacihumi TaxID=497735 RepID=V6MAI4_9BACL|nr:histidine kinase [Brevibacillus panacihumi W25]